MPRFPRGPLVVAAPVSLALAACLAREPAVLRRNSGATPEPALVVRVAPERPIVENTSTARQLNFQLRLQNRRAVPLRIAGYTLSVTDGAGALVFRRSVDGNAFVPSIAVVGASLVLAPGEIIDIFNPFSTFEREMPLAAVSVSLCLQTEADDAARARNRHRLTGDCDERVERLVQPVVDRSPTPLELPVRGRVVVWDGHDFFSHHVRVPLDDPRCRAASRSRWGRRCPAVNGSDSSDFPVIRSFLTFTMR